MEMLGIATPASFKSLMLALILATIWPYYSIFPHSSMETRSVSKCVCSNYTMRNAGVEESQPRIKIARRNINNLRYADDTTLMAESEGNSKAS